MKIRLSTLFLFLSIALTSQNLERLQANYEQRNYKRVIEEGQKLIEQYPNNTRLNYVLGRALTDYNAFKVAIPYLEKSKTAADAFPSIKAWSANYLGTCHYALDDLEQAKANFKAAFERNATQNATDYASKRIQWFQLGKYFEDWEIIETQHIRFHLQPGHQIENTVTYCTAREEAYAKINTFFRATAYKKIDFYVWHDPIEGKKVIGKTIGFANSDYCTINARVEQTEGHEITHILSDHGMKPIKRNRLINEGVAVAFDQTNRDRLALAKAVFKKGFTIKKLMQKAKRYPEEVLYPIGGALLDFLRKQGEEERLKDLLYQQTWENLIVLYSEEKIKAFEEQMKL